MEKSEEKQLVPTRDQREEREEMREIPLEELDIPISQLLEMYKRREVQRRWKI